MVSTYDSKTKSNQIYSLFNFETPDNFFLKATSNFKYLNKIIIILKVLMEHRKIQMLMVQLLMEQLSNQ